MYDAEAARLGKPTLQGLTVNEELDQEVE